jgi:hypothetical protein
VAITGTLLPGTARTGTLTLSEGTTVLATVDIATATPNGSGYYALAVPGGLAAGPHALKFAYSGDANYGASSMTCTMSVYNVSMSMSYSTSVLANQPFTVKAKVAGPLIGDAPHTGTLSLVEDTTVLATVDITQATPGTDGYFALVVNDGLSLGTHRLKLTYSGDATYNTLSYTLGTVTAATTLNTTTYLSGPTTAAAGQTITLTANVRASSLPASGGTVTFLDGSTVLGTAEVSASGVASLQTNALALGTHTLTASYAGTSSYNPSASSALNLRVVGATTNLSTSWSAPIAGQSWTPNVAINGTLLAGTPRTGTLTLTEGTTVLATVDVATVTPSSSGYYAMAVPGGLSSGVHSLKFAYSGDANYGASSMNCTMSVYNVAMSMSYSTSVLAGQPYTVKAKVVGPLINDIPRTGTLSLVEDTTVLATVDITQATPGTDGYFALVVSDGLALGTHRFKLTYSGDATYNTLTYTLGTVTAATTINTTTYLSGPTTAAAGQMITLTANVRASNLPATGGTVTFLDGTTVLGTAEVNSSGVASFKTNALALGSHTLTASYGGTSSYNPSTSSALSLRVFGATTSLSTSWSTPIAGQAWTPNVAINGTLLAGTPRTGTLTLTDGATVLATVDLATATPSSSGYYTLAVPGGLSAGSHSLKFAYSGDANYGASTMTCTMSVYNDALWLSYSNSVLTGQPYTVKAKIVGPILNDVPRTGTLSLVEDGAVLATVDIVQTAPGSDGYYSLVVSDGLSLGTHRFKVLYSGDATYNPLSYTLGTVTAATTVNTTTYLSGPTTVAAGQNVTFTANVRASNLPASGGTVTFLDGTTVLGTAEVNSSGVATFQTNALALGTHTLTASYGGTASYNPSTSSALNVRVLGATTSLSTSWSAPIAGQTWTPNVAINGTLLAGTPRTGTLTLTEGTTVLATLDVATATPSSSGYYALAVPGGLSSGSHTLKFAYSGDANYGASSMNCAMSVYNVAMSMSYSTTALAGQPYTVRAKVTGPLIGDAPHTGTLSLLEDATVLATVDITQATPGTDGYFSLTVSQGLAAGTHRFKLSYSGDAIYDALTYTLNTVTVAATVNTTTYLSGPTAAGAGQMITLTANVRASNLPATGGTVTFLDGSTVLGTAEVNASGVASFRTNALALGTHALTASYGGTSSYNPSTSSVLNLRVAGATTNLSTSWSAPIAGQAWTPNVAINGTLLAGTPRTGTLTLTEGTTVLATVDVATATPNSSGYYALAVPGGLSAGSHALKFAYSGDANYGASSMNCTMSVYNVAMSMSYSTSVLANQPYTVKAKVTGPLIGDAPHTGTLSLVEDTTVLATVDITQATPGTDGYFAIVVSDGLPLGTHRLKLTYSGDATYNALTYTLSTVTAATTVNTTTYLSGPTTAAAGQMITLTANVRASNVPAPAGTVTFLDGSTVLGTAEVNASGVASFQTNALALGTHAVTASYAGTSSYNPSTSSALNLRVFGATTSLSTSWAAPIAGQAWTANVAIKGTLLEGIPRTGTLTFTEGTTVLATVDVATATPNSSGYYALAVPAGLSQGVHTLKIAYTGDENYGGYSMTFTMTVCNDALSLSYSRTATAGQPYTVKAKVFGPLIGDAPRTGTLSLVEGTAVLATLDITQATPDGQGFFSLVASGGLSAGTHNLKVLYSGDAVYNALASNLATITVT